MLHLVLASACSMQVPPRRIDPPMPQPVPSDVPMGLPQPTPAPAAEPTGTTTQPTAVPAPEDSGSPAPAPADERSYMIDGAKRIARARPEAPTEPAAKPDRLRVRIPAEQVDLLAAGAPAGRVLVFFVVEGSRIDGDPCEAPFFEDPQPIAGIDVKDLVAGVPVELGEGTAWYPYAMDQFEGTFRVQAVLDRDATVRGHMGPGNLMGTPTTVTLSRDTEDDLMLELDAAVPQQPMPEGQVGDDPERPQLVWVNLPSALVKERGVPAVHRAGVILPPGYHDTTHARRIWPTIYVIPGFGGRHLGATSLMRVVHSEIGMTALPPAVWVVLDPDGPLGHHGFVDSVANGPRGTALATELVPWLEERFRLDARPDARIVTGHSSGGWSSLWLALTYPETFGTCFSSAPDPIDFSAFQTVDLYRDANAYVDAQGAEFPSFREPMRDAFDRVCMNNRDEIMMEWVLSPEGRSGEQWDAWSAMWSPIDSLTGDPRRLVDAATGAIDPVVVEAWSTFDIARRLREDPARYLPLWRDRVHLVCGDRDNFFLERAVERVRVTLAELPGAGAPADAATMPGYVDLLQQADHGTASALSSLRFYPEMRRWILSHEAPAAQPKAQPADGPAAEPAVAPEKP
ncbi:MAG: alpha/beta hydrolase-fold protein [Phycisphaerales bacterium]